MIDAHNKAMVRNFKCSGPENALHFYNSHIAALFLTSAFAEFACLLPRPTLTAMWNKPPYLKGWRLCFSLVYSNKIFESDAKSTRLNKAL